MKVFTFLHLEKTFKHKYEDEDRLCLQERKNYAKHNTTAFKKIFFVNKNHIYNLW